MKKIRIGDGRWIEVDDSVEIKKIPPSSKDVRGITALPVADAELESIAAPKREGVPETTRSVPMDVRSKRTMTW